MEPGPETIVRTIREGVGMSRAEFARALGWAPSTVAKWESGRARPGRLALKIILAFGEERGVRIPARRPPVVVPAVVLPPPAPRTAELVPLRPRPALSPPTVSFRIDPPRWEARLQFRVSVDGPSGRAGRRGRLRANLPLAVTACAVLLLVVSALRNDSSSPPTSPRYADASTKRGSDRPPAQRRHAVSRSRAADAPEAMEARLVPPPIPPPPATSRPVPTRLEGVTVLGGVRSATVRTNGDTVTVREGDRLGDHQIVRINGRGIEVADAAGARRTVLLGETLVVR